GKIYSFRTQGGSNWGDTYLTVTNTSNSVTYAFNDNNGPYYNDNCSGGEDDASLDWVSTFTGTVNLHVMRGGCGGWFSGNASAVLQYREVAPPADAFGNNTWRVYAYNGSDISLPSSMARFGYYENSTLDITSTSQWPSSASPSSASGWIGAPEVPIDNHTVVYKRQGFSGCKTYTINVNGHDDGASLYINGSLVWSHDNACCDAHSNVWSGFLGSSSTVEFRVEEGCGGSNLTVDFVDGTPLTITNPSSNITVNCNSSPISLSASSPGGTWSGPGVSGSTFTPAAAGPGTHTISYTLEGCTVTRQITVNANGTAGTFGSNYWYVSCYQGRDLNLGGGVTYYGYYTENNLNFNSQNRWPSSGSPSSANSASGQAYQGCTITADNHTTVSKRQGFPCGVYQINILGHDDEARLYINGTQVWEHIGCCDNHTNVWTGLLDGSSTVEFRCAEGGGGSNFNVEFIDVTSISPGSINGNQVLCDHGSGVNPTVLGNTSSASGNAGSLTYSWEYQNNCTGGWNVISGANGATYDPPAGLTQTRCYRRRVTDYCGNTAVSNTVTVTVYAAPGQPVAPSTIDGCGNVTIYTQIGSGGHTNVFYNSSMVQLATGTQYTTNISGTYYVTTRNNTTGCESQPVQVQLTSTPSFTLTVSGTNPSCNSANGNNANGIATATITGGGTPPYQYAWSNGTTNTTSSTSNSITGLQAGTYAVTVTDAGNCVEIGQVTLTEPTAMNITANIPTFNGYNIDCNGNNTGSIDISITGGSGTYTNFDWADLPGSSNPEDRSGLTAGTYTVTVTDNNGCTASQSFTLTEPTELELNINVSYVCDASGSYIDAQITAIGSGGVSPYDYRINGGSWGSTNTWSGLSDGSVHTVEVRDQNGCIKSQVVNINYPSPGTATGHCDFVYVTTTGGGPLGTKECPTDLLTAISIASTSTRKHILMAGGTYNFNAPIVLDNNITIDGGYDIVGNEWRKNSSVITRLVINPT
ncbi:MAG: hypothetical protein D6706_18305, partial [Chloroflexi bacterium]